MKFDMTVGSFADLANDLEGTIASAATEAMRTTMPIARQELREQVVSAGLGTRLANTWRGEAYPKSRRSVSPAGYIWSNAPDIVDSFERGATIMPLGGKRFLAIPTANVPRAGQRRGATRRMTPVEVQGAFNQELFFRRGRSGRVLAFVNAIQAQNRRGFRRGTARRLAAGRALKPILMFVLVPTTRLPKLLDINSVAQRWAERFEREFNERIGAP